MTDDEALRGCLEWARERLRAAGPPLGSSTPLDGRLGPEGVRFVGLGGALHAHCYRVLGSVQDDDALHEPRAAPPPAAHRGAGARADERYGAAARRSSTYGRA